MHIYRMPNGRWRVVVQDEGRRRSKVAPTEREAKRAGAQLMIELGKEPHRTGATVDDLLDLHLAQSELAKTTAKDYEYLIAKLPDWIKQWRVEQTTTMMVDQAYRTLLRDGWSIHRVRRLHEVLRPAFDRAARWGWIPANPVASAVPPRKPDTRKTVPDVDHVQRLIDAATARSPDLGCAILVASRTGVRRGELCALQWDDLDDTATTINVCRSVTTTVGDAHHERQGKTGRAGHRTIPVGPAVTLALRTHRARMAERALERGHPLAPWMFTNDGAHPWRTDYVTLALSRICEDHDVDIHIHQLRHFAATQWIAAGMDPRTVSYLLGHARTSTTMDIYSAYMPTKGQEAADIMERLFTER
jgi:integrase